MKRQRIFSTVLTSAAAFVAIAGIASGAVSFTGQGTVAVDSLSVGKQGSGGTTAFNGSIVNTTTTGGVGNPVTFGDDVRIDGRVWRGATAGTGDTKPFSINDNAEIAGSLTVGGLRVLGTKRYEGTFDTSADGDEVTRYSGDTTCTYGATSLKYYHVHWKKLTVPEITLSAIPSVRMFVKPVTPAGYTPNYFPRSGDVWSSVGYVVSEGALYYQFKTISELCSGTMTTTYNTTGEYQIVSQ